MKVFVLNKHGKPLMPTNPRKARLLLKGGKAKIIKHAPFTIQLNYGSSGYKQPITLGVDAGYQNIGFSAVTEKEELLSGEAILLSDMSERITERAMYRNQRRCRKRHRKPRFDNRRRDKGWLAPSIQHKFDTHRAEGFDVSPSITPRLGMVNLIKSILPITTVVVEIANFDIQKVKNPEIEGKGYQEGEQSGYWNLREYILHRDKHSCQNPDCTSNAKQKILQVHHVGYWKFDRSDRPGNLITLCTKCHTASNHKEEGFLYGWRPKLKSFRPETFMCMVRWRLVNVLKCDYTYGYLTKSGRMDLELPKTHIHDAFVIAGGTHQNRAEPIFIEQIRRNNRSLQKFYDAKYIDIRTGKKESGQTLNNGRRTRNKNHNGENLRVYREQKVSKGRVSIRRQRYQFQPNDVVVFEKQKYRVKGVQNYGAYVKLDSLSKPVRTDMVTPLRWRKGLCVIV